MPEIGCKSDIKRQAFELTVMCKNLFQA